MGGILYNNRLSFLFRGASKYEVIFSQADLSPIESHVHGVCSFSFDCISYHP